MKMFSQLATLLKQKHPQEFGEYGVTLECGKNVGVGKNRGRGGGKATEEEHLATRLRDVIHQTVNIKFYIDPQSHHLVMWTIAQQSNT
jgi:hypothetical protein